MYCINISATLINSIGLHTTRYRELVIFNYLHRANYRQPPKISTLFSHTHYGLHFVRHIKLKRIESDTLFSHTHYGLHFVRHIKLKRIESDTLFSHTHYGLHFVRHIKLKSIESDGVIFLFIQLCSISTVVCMLKYN